MECKYETHLGALVKHVLTHHYEGDYLKKCEDQTNIWIPTNLEEVDSEQKISS